MPNSTLYFPVLIRRTNYSKGRKYSDYRPEIREDCQRRCVYCDAHENVLGGHEAMQIDHFQPQSIFPDLKHNPNNLLWVCNRCNCLKRDDWHETDISQLQSTKVGYLDPFLVDRGQFFSVEDDGTLKPISGPSNYIIHRLKLNRAFLIYVRRSRRVLHEFIEKVDQYFAEQIVFQQDLLARGAITDDECRQQVQKASAMKEAVLEFIQSFANI